MGDDREEIARIIDPGAFERAELSIKWDRQDRKPDLHPMFSPGTALRLLEVQEAYAKADAILARQGQPTGGDDREEIALSVLRRIADESGVCGNCGTKCEKVTDGCCDRPWWKPLCPASEARAALAILARAQGPGPGEASEKGNHDCLAKRRPGEPMFILLGRDPDAHNIVRMWAERRLSAGGDPEHCQMGLDTAERMRAYAADPANAPASAPRAEAYPGPGEAVAKKTMCLTLTDAEMAALEEVMKARDATPKTIFRSALKLFQLEARGFAKVSVDLGPLAATPTREA